MVEFSLVAVFLVGLLSGVHCLGMCGSIVGVFTAQMPKPPIQLSPGGERATESPFGRGLG